MQQPKHLLLIFGLVLLCLQGQSQSVVPIANEDTIKITNLLTVCEQVMSSDIEKAQNLAMQGRDLSVKFNFKAGEARALKLIGNTYYFTGKPFEAISYWSQSLSVLRELKDESGEARLLGNLGSAYTNQEDDVKALEYHLGSLKLAEKLDY